MGQYSSYYLYQKYEKRGDQPFVPVYPAVYSVDGDGTREPVVKNENDYQCGWTGETGTLYRWVDLPIDTDYICDTCPMYRWVTIPITSDYVCVGTTKYYKEKQQISYDNGETWEDTGDYRSGAVFETQSEDCGYVPPIVPQYRWVDTGDFLCVEVSPTPPYSEQYLTIQSVEDNNDILWTVDKDERDTSFTKTISASTDDGASWTAITASSGGTRVATLNRREKVLIKGLNQTYHSDNYSYEHCCFSASRYYTVYGNIMSLVSGDSFVSASTVTDYCFSSLFSGSDTLMSAKNLVLPATELATDCYYCMFRDCTSLTAAPELPATTLAPYCYSNMFNGCTSLTTAPELPVTTLSSGCYSYMFSGCTSLTTAPELPAETLAGSCYNYMFGSCTSLTIAPELPATILAPYCYSYMFNNCTRLNYIKCLATDISATNCTYNWVRYVSSSSGTFVKSSSMSSWTFGKNGIPTGWTVQGA